MLCRFLPLPPLFVHFHVEMEIRRYLKEDAADAADSFMLTNYFRISQTAGIVYRV